MQKVSHMQNTTLSLFESPRQTAIREDLGERSARNRGALSRTWSRLSIHIVETWGSCPRCGAPASESSTCDRSADRTACAATPAAPSIIDGILKIHPSALNDSRPGARELLLLDRTRHRGIGHLAAAPATTQKASIQKIRIRHQSNQWPRCRPPSMHAGEASHLLYKMQGKENTSSLSAHVSASSTISLLRSLRSTICRRTDATRRRRSR